MKETIKLIAVLTTICAICSALLAAVYGITKAPIAAALEQRTAKAALDVMPPDVSTPEKITVGNHTLFVAKESGKVAGIALEARSSNGYGGEIVLMVGLNSQGQLVSYQVLQASETPGLGTKISESLFITPLLGKPISYNWRVKQDGGDIDAITAATISSRAVMEALTQAAAIYAEVIIKLEE